MAKFFSWSIFERLLLTAAIIATGLFLYSRAPRLFALFSSDSANVNDGHAVEEQMIQQVAEDASKTVPTPEALPPKLSDLEQTIAYQLQVKFQSGDFFGALQYVKMHLTKKDLSPAFKIWLKKQLPILLTSAGWIHLKMEQCDDAIELFTEAIALQGETPETSKGLGLCYYRTKNSLAAKEYFRQYNATNASQTNDWQILLLEADVLETLQHYDEAVELLEKTRRLVPNLKNSEITADIDRRLKSMRAKQQEWSNQAKESTPHFLVLYRPDEHAHVIDTLLLSLEDTLFEFVRVFGFQEPKSRIEVALYPSDVFSNVLPDSPKWVAGVFDGRLRLPVPPADLFDMQHFESLLRHEMIHALLNTSTNFKTLPPWFEEGLAQYAACKPIGCPNTQWPSKRSDMLPTNDLLTNFMKLDETKALLAYHQSLFMFKQLVSSQPADSLHVMIDHLSHNHILSSDDLLQPLKSKMDFNKLYNISKTAWENRVR